MSGNEEMIRAIQLEEFSNEIALDMGLKVIEEARSSGKKVAVSVDRLNHNVFKFFSEGLPADKHDWLRRKANVAIRFEESSLAVKTDLERGGMSLKNTFGLESNDYIAKGGSIPIKVNNSGLVAVITVSGLSDVEDHNLIVTALKGYI
jgi:Uncharacterized conserved protein